jgi:hypothetical protein
MLQGRANRTRRSHGYYTLDSKFEMILREMTCAEVLCCIKSALELRARKASDETEWATRNFCESVFTGGRICNAQVYAARRREKQRLLFDGGGHIWRVGGNFWLQKEQNTIHFINKKPINF